MSMTIKSLVLGLVKRPPYSYKPVGAVKHEMIRRALINMFNNEIQTTPDFHRSVQIFVTDRLVQLYGHGSLKATGYFGHWNLEADNYVLVPGVRRDISFRYVMRDIAGNCGPFYRAIRECSLSHKIMITVPTRRAGNDFNTDIYNSGHWWRNATIKTGCHYAAFAKLQLAMSTAMLFMHYGDSRGILKQISEIPEWTVCSSNNYGPVGGRFMELDLGDNYYGPVRIGYATDKLKTMPVNRTLEPLAYQVSSKQPDALHSRP
jgi:hypothetical protein